jgi:SAM-dependent methyltransferase
MSIANGAAALRGDEPCVCVVDHGERQSGGRQSPSARTSIQRTRARLRDRPRPLIPRRPVRRAPHPTESALNRLAHAQPEDALYHIAAAHATGRLVDVGCGRKRYAELLSPFVSERVGVDHPDSPHPLAPADVLASAYEMPLPSNSFDTALLTEVIEHLEDPCAALREIRRVLKSGGRVILTAPFMWVLHEEPRDYYRYSPQGLRRVRTEAGFDDIEVWPISGQWSTVMLLFGYALRPYRVGLLRPLIDRAALASQAVAPWLDDNHFKPGGTYDHIAVATNSATAPSEELST